MVSKERRGYGDRHILLHNVRRRGSFRSFLVYLDFYHLLCVGNVDALIWLDLCKSGEICSRRKRYAKSHLTKRRDKIMSHLELKPWNYDSHIVHTYGPEYTYDTIDE